MAKVIFVNFFIKTYSILLIQYMYKSSCEMDKNFQRYSMFFHRGPTSPPPHPTTPALRFPKKPSTGRLKKWSQHFENFSTNVPIVEEDLLKAFYIFFIVLWFKWSVKTHCIATVLQAIWQIFSHENKINYNS